MAVFVMLRVEEGTMGWVRSSAAECGEGARDEVTFSLGCTGGDVFRA